MLNTSPTANPADAKRPRPAFADRPPVLEALKTLGLTDARIARAIGCTSEFIASWRSGKRAIPPKTQAALLFLVGRLTEQIGAGIPVQSKYARRAAAAVEAAKLWNNLARDEFAESLGTDDPGRDYRKLVLDGYELGRRALARLEAADSS